ncbi:ABC transporter ATP-binding protein [Algoriphagus lacus]|uniref:ABC transporter ATP-binding protein n=1 Tax=Algoriphagus lacus TaxID=2056311 RepID=A0A418PQE5_9BACT|nr:ABC transporter transmembrane domain-containing protein [Algoriphagus lacus]RIW14526.1 ABC transporter ATP-binding protein [Algoriphagus lacus]
MDWIKNRTLQKKWIRNNPKVWIFLILGWFASISTFFLSLMVGWFFDLHYSESINKSALLEKLGFQVDNFSVFFMIMAIVIFAKFTLQLIERKGINQAAETLIHRITGRLYGKQMSWSEELFSERPFGKYLLRYSGDMSSIRGMLVNGIHRGIRDGLFLICGIALLFWVNYQWTLVVVLGSLLILPVFIYLDRKQLSSITAKQNSKNELLNFVTTSFSNHQKILEKNQVERNLRGFRRRNREVMAAVDSFQKWESLRHALVNSTGPALIFFILGMIWLIPNQSSPGELLTFLLIMGAMTPALRNVIKAPSLIQKGLLSLRKIEHLIRKKEKIKTMEPVDSKILPLSKIQPGVK